MATARPSSGLSAEENSPAAFSTTLQGSHPIPRRHNVPRLGAVCVDCASSGGFQQLAAWLASLFRRKRLLERGSRRHRNRTTLQPPHHECGHGSGSYPLRSLQSSVQDGGGQPDCAERYTAPRCLLHNSLLRGGGNLLGSNFRFTEIKPAFICRFFHLSRLDEDRVDETVEAGGKWQI
jgi:hypothetical protein